MILVNSFPEHNKYKNDLLKMIDDMLITTNDIKPHPGDNISKTDFFLPKDKPRPYLEIFNKMIDPFIKKMTINLNSCYYEVPYIWFQQYNHNDTHNWHNHTGCQFANVYFLELEDNSLGTEFLDKQYNVKLKEGDVLTFPSYLYHRSPINLTKTRKTIISFNSSFSNFKKNETKN
jgi:hypothetical protein